MWSNFIKFEDKWADRGATSTLFPVSHVCLHVEALNWYHWCWTYTLGGNSKQQKRFECPLTSDLCVLWPAGAIMEDLAKNLLDAKMCDFLPKHNKNLSNEFRCFVNYPSRLLSCWGAGRLSGTSRVDGGRRMSQRDNPAPRLTDRTVQEGRHVWRRWTCSVFMLSLNDYSWTRKQLFNPWDFNFG